ncbi:adenylate isopentenyltransferase 5 chloroplastic [Phtheirospermum japonicum]|uniref:Adenylate isopentenyltransferase 5 chloroplastic n=1 Tax=Phtheirospermum japonicum TaxID=374723 RepID=A0A830B3R7_9LAMI|nr:adenylate isopentenyltransferase 5 chloroplastic [Phtheirospermum japonicum]
MGATGTGKSRLAIDLATTFGGEIINCDKIQVYKGLDLIANKVTEVECRGVPHHLLGIIEDPNEDFTAVDFISHTLLAAEDIVKRSRLPIIAGGSNSFIQALVDNPDFKSKYECCFLWVDVSVPVLHSSVRKRVDQMVVAGLVGIRRAIGVPEMDGFFKMEGSVEAEARADLLKAAVEEIKVNTCKLTHRQLEKIFTIGERLKWQGVHRLDATEVYLRRSGDVAEDVWQRLMVGPGTRIVSEFLGGGEEDVKESKSSHFASNVASAMDNN